jgi:peptidoglycan/xylan/chitin deacetylase (PgdA/CDA1 family)
VRLLKSAVKRTSFTVGLRGLRRVTAPRATVLLYHRVTDGVRDNLTVGVEQFDRQMALLRRHFQVVSPADLLEWEAVPRTDRPLVCVTFDDGYLDNYLNAVPILLRHEIPAAFFVSTGIVGTDRRFPHDIRRGNPPIPVMRWDHLREMHEAGFVIGSHTVSHIDCAAEPEDLVRAEMEQSREDLRRELGLREVLFAYPYGGRQHMTPDRLELVKRAGYVGCLSAYGGSNVGRVDRFNVLRRGIHWEFSDPAFLAESLGFR